MSRQLTNPPKQSPATVILLAFGLVALAVLISRSASTQPNEQVARDNQTQEAILHQPPQNKMFRYRNRFTLGTAAQVEALQARYDLLNWNTPEDTNRIVVFHSDLPHD